MFLDESIWQIQRPKQVSEDVTGILSISFVTCFWDRLASLSTDGLLHAHLGLCPFWGPQLRCLTVHPALGPAAHNSHT